MTTLREEEETCANCQQATKFTVALSTNAFGSPDLDLRPPPMKRDLLSLGVRQCPNCGLCASQLSDPEGLETRVVGSTEYVATLNDPLFPQLACQYRAMAMLANAAGNTARASPAILHAAWACDDAGDEYQESAAQCRRELLVQIDSLHASGKSFANDDATDAVLRLDLLRRSGDFTGVEDSAEALSRKELPELLAQVVAFQRRKARDNDRARYTVQEAIPNS